MDYVFVAAHTIIIATALWAIFSRRINDGLFGKIALAFMCVSSVACIGWAMEFPGTVDQSDAVFSAAVACMSVRCYWLKMWAPKTRRAVKRKIKGARK